jgi:hypothetical protein
MNAYCVFRMSCGTASRSFASDSPRGLAPIGTAFSSASRLRGIPAIVEEMRRSKEEADKREAAEEDQPGVWLSATAARRGWRSAARRCGAARGSCEGRERGSSGGPPTSQRRSADP